MAASILSPLLLFWTLLSGAQAFHAAHGLLLQQQQQQQQHVDYQRWASSKSGTTVVRKGLLDDPVGWIKRGMDVMSDDREAEAHHILIKAVTKEQTEEAVANLQALKEKLASAGEGEGEAGRALEAFAAAAKEVSECPSAANGGSLGRFKRGAMVPKFDDAVFSGEVGEVIGPLQTVYGAHLIYIKSRTLDAR